MTTVRCPSCDAAAPAEASWCTLCFAPLAAAETPAVDPWVAAAVAEAPLPPSIAAVAPALPVAPAPLATSAPPVVPAPPVAPPPVPVAWTAPAAPVQPLPAPPLPVPSIPVPQATVPQATVPQATVPQATVPVPPQAVAPQTSAVATVVEAPSWPCTACSTKVDFALAACPDCGTPFMGGANPNVSLKVPGVGDLVHMSSGAKFGVMAGGAAVLAGVLVLLFVILGHIF